MGELDGSVKVDAQSDKARFTHITTRYTGTADAKNLKSPEVYTMFQEARRDQGIDEWWLVVHFERLDTTVTVLFEKDQDDPHSFRIEWYGGDRKKIALDENEAAFAAGPLYYDPETHQTLTNTAEFYLDSFFVDIEPKHMALTKQGADSEVEWPGYGPRGMLFVQWYLANIGVQQVELADAWRRTLRPDKVKAMVPDLNEKELRRRGIDSVAQPGSFLISSDEYAAMIALRHAGKVAELEADTAYPAMSEGLERDYAEMKANGTVDEVIESGWYGRYGFHKTGNEYGHGEWTANTVKMKAIRTSFASGGVVGHQV